MHRLREGHGSRAMLNEARRLERAENHVPSPDPHIPLRRAMDYPFVSLNVEMPAKPTFKRSGTAFALPPMPSVLRRAEGLMS